MKDLQITSGQFAFVCTSLFLLTVCCSSGFASNSQLFVPEDVKCACPQDVLTFSCQVAGSGVTIWRGSVFKCPDQNNEIILRHSQYEMGSASGFCQDDVTRIDGDGLQNVTNGLFTSQVTIPVSANFNGASVECAHNDGQRTTTVDSATLNVVTGLFKPIDYIRLVSVSPGQLVFKWSPVAPGCPSIQYSITALNCGECVYNYTTSNATCSIPRLGTTFSICTFSIQSTACSNSFNDSLEATLKVPSIAEATVVPHYDIGGGLIRVSIATTEETFVIADGINSSILFYTIMFSEYIFDSMCIASRNLSDVTCLDDVCNIEIELPLSPCPFSAQTINVSLSATNPLGGGPSSDVYAIGGRNDFVDLKIRSINDGSVVVNCSFLDLKEFSRKSCSISYGPNKQMLIWSANGSSNLSFISLSLNGDFQDKTELFYVVTASNASFTLKVEGTLNLAPCIDYLSKFKPKDSQSQSSLNLAAAVAVPVFGIVLTVTLAILVVAVLLFKYRSKSAAINTEELSLDDLSERVETTKNSRFGSKTEEATFMEPEKPPLPRFEILKVEEDCELREFVETKCGRVFKRGCAFFEFTHEIEDIPGTKGVVLLKKSTGEFITGSTASKKIGAPGEAIRRPHLSNYTVFVQSIGTGARHISGNSSILYEKPYSIEKTKDDEKLLMPLLKKRVQLIQLRENLTFSGVCKKYEINFPTDNVYLELAVMKRLQKDKEICDVILLDKESGELLTGPRAKEIAEEYFQKDIDVEGSIEVQISSPDVEGPVEVRVSSVGAKNKTRMVTILVSCKYRGDLPLVEDTLVLIKNPCTTPKTLIPLNVVKDCVQMSALIKAAGYEFDNGRAYYEFVREEEDVFDDTDIVLMERDSDSDAKDPILFTGPDARYKIPGAPGIGIKAPNLKKYRVFVQSKSQGSRCLRAGTSVLYCTDPKEQQL